MRITGGRVFDPEQGFVRRDVCTDGALISADSGDDRLVRRVTGIRGSWVRLNCDAKTTRDQEVLAEPDQLLGKVIFSFGGM